MRFYLTFFTVFLSAFCFSTEILDIETLPLQRSQRYPIGPYHKIVVLSAPRTGSSVVYNIFRFLFEEEGSLVKSHRFELDRYVVKTHRLDQLSMLPVEEKVLFVIPLRHPVDACISNYRISPNSDQNLKEFTKRIVQRHKSYFEFYDELQITGKDVFFLRYEEFADDLDSLLLAIEGYFHVDISLADKDLIKRGYNRNNIHAWTSEFASFRECFAVSGFHGQHVSLQEYKPPQQFLHWLYFYLSRMKLLIEKYGYSLKKSS